MSEQLRAIEVERYGREGYKPKEKHLCIYRGENSCVSSSSDSLCGGYNGMQKVLDREFVLCGEDNN